MEMNCMSQCLFRVQFNGRTNQHIFKMLYQRTRVNALEEFSFKFQNFFELNCACCWDIDNWMQVKYFNCAERKLTTKIPSSLSAENGPHRTTPAVIWEFVFGSNCKEHFNL